MMSVVGAKADVGGHRRAVVGGHMRMNMRRFTRLTNAFFKKVENHAHAVALHMMYYNFVRIHKMTESHSRDGCGRD
jgi:hypothetical protein